MKVNRVQNIDLKPQSAPPPTYSENPICQAEELPAVSSGTLRAYNNIPFKGKFVPKTDFTSWLESTGFMRKDIIDDVFNAFCDETTQLSEKTFEIIKKLKEKGVSVFGSMGIFERAKENGKINYGAVELVENMIPVKKGCCYFRNESVYYRMLHMLKDENGKINERVIELLRKDPKVFNAYMERFPESFFKCIKDGEGRFSPEAIEYFKKHLDNQEKVQNVINDLYSAKNADGTIDLDNIELNHRIKEQFSSDSFIVKDIVMNSPKEQRQGIIEIAKTIKDEEHFNAIMHGMKSFNLDFNEANIEFVKKLADLTYGRNEYMELFSTKLKLTPKMLNEDTEKLLSNLCSMFSSKDLEVIMDCASYKAGKNKGVIDLENLKLYKEIYTSEHNIMQSIQDLSSKLSLEEDNKALKIFHKLYTMQFPNGKYSDKIDRTLINNIIVLSTMSFDNIAKRQAYREVLDNLEKLLSMKYPTQSKKTLENFLLVPDFEAIEKLERVKFEEVGIKAEQASSLFQNTDEDKLLKLKDFIRKYEKENGISDIDIAVNPNINNRYEITSGTGNNKNILLYDFEKHEPITNMQVEENYRQIIKTQRDYNNNTETRIVFRKKDVGLYHGLETLESQTIKHFDASGKEIYREVLEPSCIKGVPNIKKVYPDGREEQICKAYVNPETGFEVIEKDMVSLDGTRTLYRRETDRNGCCITDYTITDKNGKTLFSQSSTYEKIDENHYRTSKNKTAYDVRFDNNTITVTNENTKQTRVLNISELTEGSEINLIPLLKQLSGDELFLMKETGLKNIKYRKYNPGASFSPTEKVIRIGKDMDDDGILLHEFGHGKDDMLFEEIGEKINKDPELQRIYNQEREAFRNKFSESQLDLIGYFTADHHYTDNALIEGIAETNTLLNTYPRNDIQKIRAHYWQQYFPNTIAYIAQLIG